MCGGQFASNLGGGWGGVSIQGGGEGGGRGREGACGDGRAGFKTSFGGRISHQVFVFDFLRQSFLKIRVAFPVSCYRTENPKESN